MFKMQETITRMRRKLGLCVNTYIWNLTKLDEVDDAF